MKIGIDCRMYRTKTGGIGRYSQNLVKNLLEIDKENQYILFMTRQDKKDYHLKAKNATLKIVDIPHYSIAEQTKLASIIEKEKLDLVDFLNFNYPINYQGKFIITIHDLTLFFYPQTARETNFIKRAAFRYILKKGCRDSQKIITVSKSTKADIIEILKVDPQKIAVIYEAADDKSFQECSKKQIERLKNKYHLSENVILSVGQFRSHKNLPRLVEALAILRKSMPCKLVILGKPDPTYHEFQETLDKTGAKKDIIMPGFVSDEELNSWYKLAKVFVFPSLYEGFGLPGLEAMQAGLPVASSDKGSLGEIYSDAALYFNPLDPADMAEKIKKVIKDNDLRKKLIKKGREVAANFSWQKTAQQTLEIYKEILEKR